MTLPDYVKNPPKTIRLIKQRGPSDCAPCSMAMLTGLPLKKVIEIIGDTWHPEKGMANEIKALQRLGYRRKLVPHPTVKQARVIVNIDFKTHWRPSEISREYYKDQIWGRRALLSAPSLNNPGGMHMVYWHYDRLYDPSPKRQYGNFESVEVDSMVVFMEKPQ